MRCVNCNHAWHETPPADMPKSLALEPVLTFPPLSADTELPPTSESKRIGFNGWALVLILILAVIVGGWFGRQQIVEFWPPAGRIYSQLGLGIAGQPRFGLVLRNLNSSTQIENGAAVLGISGEIVNVIDETRPTPKLRVILRDADKRELKNFIHTVEGSNISPGDKVTFNIKLSEPPPEARDLEVTFIAEN